jgi:acyl carrier protein
MSLEEEFSNPSRKIEIPDDDAQKMATIQDVIVYLNGLGIKDN